MLASDELNSLRDKLGEPDPNGRFSNVELLRNINEARRDISLAVRFPEMRLTGTCIPGTQEYAVSEDMQAIKRVYVGGQRLPETDIATLEGEGMQFFDQTGPLMQPQWKAAAPAFYPVTSDSGYPAPIALPYFQGQRPMFYTRSNGAVVGFVPPPGGGESIIVEGIAIVPDLVNPGDTEPFPRIYLGAISWMAARLALFADKDTDMYPIAADEAEKALMALREELATMAPQAGLRPLTYRSIFNQSFGHRRGRRW